MSRETKLTMIMTGYLIISNILLVPDMHSELKSFPVPQPEPFGEQLSDDGQGTSTSGYHCFPSGVKSTDNIEHYIFHLPPSICKNCDYPFLQPAEQPTMNSSTSTPVLRPTTPTGGGEEPNSQELVRLLQEKDRRIQFLEVKIQQLTQVGYGYGYII